MYKLFLSILGAVAMGPMANASETAEGIECRAIKNTQGIQASLYMGVQECVKNSDCVIASIPAVKPCPTAVHEVELAAYDLYASSQEGTRLHELYREKSCYKYFPVVKCAMPKAAACNSENRCESVY